MSQIRRIVTTQNYSAGVTLQTLHPLHMILPQDLQMGPLAGPTFVKWLEGYEIFCYLTDTEEQLFKLPFALHGRIIPSDWYGHHEMDRAFDFQVESAGGGDYLVAFDQNQNNKE